MEAKTIAIIAVVIIVLAFLAYNQFSPKERPIEDENATMPDDTNLTSQKDVMTPEELAAYEEQLVKSDPVRHEAIEKKDASICNKESKTDDIGWCKAAVAEVLADESICPGLIGNPKNQCYNDVARAKAKKELCQNITDLDFRDDCILGISQTTLDLDGCLLIQNSDKGDNCIGEIAMEENDVSICQKARDAEFKDDCISVLAVQMNSPETCFLASDKEAANYCVMIIAVSNEDESICSKILNSETRDACILYVTGE